MKVPYFKPWINQNDKNSVINALNNRWLTNGPILRKFEDEIKNYVGTKFSSGVGSATHALHLAMRSLGIGPNDEVIVPTFTFVATANAVVSTGAKPVFVDILKENYTMDPDDLHKKITKNSKAILPVHLYGNVAYLDKISEIAKKFNIPIVEDSAQSLGSTFKGKHTGTFFEMGCFSMYPAKVMTSGEGGFIVTNNKKLRDKLLMIRNHGMVKGYDTRILGLNLRLPEINAAIGTIQIKKLPKFLKTRQKNAELFSKLLSKSNLTLPQQRKNEKVNWYLYTVTTSKRNILLKRLNEKGIGAASYYPIPVHKTPFYKSKIKLPVTDWSASHVLSLPIHPKVTSKNIEFVAKTISEIL